MVYQKVMIAASAIAVYNNQKDPEKKKNMALDLMDQLAEVLMYT